MGHDELYLSRLVLNTSNPNVQMANARAQVMHGVLMEAFNVKKSGRERAEAGLLYRIEPGYIGQEQTMVVQSTMEPNWSHLRQRRDVFAFESDVKEIGDIFGTLHKGRMLRFRVMLNARSRVGRSPREINDKDSDSETYEEAVIQVGEQSGADAGKHTKKPRCRKRRRTQEKTNLDFIDVIDWFRRRDSTLGFALTRDEEGSVQLTVSPRMVTFIRNRREVLVGCLVNGVLVVTDEERFEESIRAGIGRGKTYGFGLLSVSPHHTL